MWQAFHFIRPEWLYAIPVIAVILFLFVRRSSQSSAWEKVCDPALLQYQLSAQENQPASHSTRMLHWIVPFVFLLTIIALAGPTWEKKEQPVFQQGSALVIILDLSLSMNAKDIKPSRLERAKLKIIDILKQKKEGQSALIAFAGDAHTVSPLTIDNKTIMSLLPALESSIMPLSGSHIIDSLTTAKQLLKNAGFAKGDILLITDGIDPAQQKQLKKTVKQLYQQGYYFSAIGVGSQAGSPIPLPSQGGFVKDEKGQVVLTRLTPAPLKSLTQTGGGSYHPLSLNDDDFKTLLDKRLLNNEAVTEQENQLEQWVDAGVYITILLIPIALLAFRKGLLSIVVILLLAPAVYTEPATANTDVTMEPDNSKDTSQHQSKTALKEWNDLWATPDQQGQKAFKTQDYQQAAEKFNHTNWKGSAYYRSGNFEKALQQYEQTEDATSLYNKANVLANLQKFQEAIDTYDEALKLDPQLEDAEQNRDYLKELLTQQEQQSGQDSNKQQDQQQEKSDQESSEEQNQDQQSSSNGDSENSSEKSDSESSQSEDKNNAKGTNGDSEDLSSQENSSQENSSQENSSQENSSQEKDSKEKDSEKTEQEKDNQSEKGENETNAQEHSDPSESDQPQSSEPVSPNQPQENASIPEQSPPAAQSEAPQEDSRQEGTDTPQTDDVLSQLSQEEQQSLKQWLQRIPDNPGELLRIKFRNNSILKQRQQEAPEHYKGNPW